MKPCVDVVTNAEVMARLRQPGQVAHIPASYANKVASSLDMFENFPFALDRVDVDKLLGGTVAMDTSRLMPIYRIGVNSIKVELLDFFAKNPQILERRRGAGRRRAPHVRAAPRDRAGAVGGAR